MSILKHQWFYRQASAVVREEDGQIIPWVLLMMFFLLGMCALSIDVGHAMLVQRELQASADAAALAAAQHIDAGDWQTYALNYSAATGKYNQYTEYGTGTPTITGYCSTTVAKWLSTSCTNSSLPVNAVKVTEQAVVSMIFTQYINIPTITVSATATASKGGKPLPFNVAIILDTTPSMDYTDGSCKDKNGNLVKVNGNTATQLQCATIGVQTLLAGLAPSVDYVSLFTFPNVTTATLSSDTDCSSSTNPYVTPYTFPSSTATSLTNPSYTGAVYDIHGNNVGSGSYTSTYQITGFLTDYRSSDSSTTISTSSSLSNAVGIGSSSNCSAMQTSYENTYYAGAIYAAQSALLAEKATRTAAGQDSGNAIILLSDGDATAKHSGYNNSFSPGSNDMLTSGMAGTGYTGLVATSSGTYPSWVDQCRQGIQAANSASSQGTIVFTIAYGSSTSNGCNSDYGATWGGSSITPCRAMQYMSSGWPNNTSHFYSDDTVNGSSSGCAAVMPASNLQSIFDAIRGQLTQARLIPNGTA
ncbi:MAG: pilus assembly protein TadG-related protein [Terracidiphilus sp.]|nr:pilus assembly protein TadG-related protein [Terracidiphilus sp.]